MNLKCFKRSKGLILLLVVFFSCIVDENERNQVLKDDIKQFESLENWYLNNLSLIKKNESNKISNNRVKNDDFNRLKLDFHENEIDWESFETFEYPDGTLGYEFKIKNPKLVYPYHLLSVVDSNKVEGRIHQSILFLKKNENIKAFILRYYDHDKKIDRNSLNYKNLPHNWKGEIGVYKLDETHLVTFNILGGQIYSTKEYHLTEKDEELKVKSNSNLNTYCTITWTPGPCEPMGEGVGIICYDTFTTTCYSSTPPLMLGYAIWSGSGGGWGTGGGGGFGDQYLCDFDPECIPHPDVLPDPYEVLSFEGYDDTPVAFNLDQNPTAKNWQTSTSSERFLNLISHIRDAKSKGMTNLNIRNILLTGLRISKREVQLRLVGLIYNLMDRF